MMKIFRYGLLFSTIAVLGAMVVCQPGWLANNWFINQFVSSEIVAVLIVILTITFASVANIHLSLNRISQRHGKSFADRLARIRRKINGDAWLIFWAFVVCLAALLIKGGAGENVYLLAVAHAVALVVLLINVLVLHTIYRSIFALVAAENLNVGGDRNGGQDFTSESPEIGQS